MLRALSLLMLKQDQLAKNHLKLCQNEQVPVWPNALCIYTYVYINDDIIMYI